MAMKIAQAGGKVLAWGREFCAPLKNASAIERTRWAILTVVFSMASFGAMYLFAVNWSIGIDLQRSKCLPGTLFLIDKKNPVPVRDSIFAFRVMSAEPVLKNGTKLAKYVRGVPGDTISITQDEKILINGKLVAEGMPHLHGLNPKKMDKFFGTRTLAEGEYWMMGTAYMSFDSRYYGPVRIEQFEGKAYVVF